MAKTALRVKQARKPKFARTRLYPMPAMRPAEGGIPQVRPVSHLSAGDGAQGRVARHHEIVVVIDMLDSSLIVAALGGNSRTQTGSPLGRTNEDRRQPNAAPFDRPRAHDPQQRNRS